MSRYLDFNKREPCAVCVVNWPPNLGISQKIAHLAFANLSYRDNTSKVDKESTTPRKTGSRYIRRKLYIFKDGPKELAGWPTK